MKSLILASNPRKDLNLDREIRDLKSVIEGIREKQTLEVEDALAVRVGDLQDLLFKHRPDIVHFCGHGSGQQGLVFEDSSNTERCVRTEALSDLFRLFSQDIGCVLLNACYSEEQANAIVSHIDYVIGMQQEIRDDAAIAFSKGFYRALGHGRSVEQAYEFGCNAIHLEISGSTETIRSARPIANSTPPGADIAPMGSIPEHLKPVLKHRSASIQQGPFSHNHSAAPPATSQQPPDGQTDGQPAILSPARFKQSLSKSPLLTKPIVITISIASAISLAVGIATLRPTTNPNHLPNAPTLSESDTAPPADNVGPVANPKSPTVSPQPYQFTQPLEQTILPDGFFTWSDATHRGERIPQSQEIEANIVAIVIELEKIKEEIVPGKEIVIIEWYRDPPANRAVGGARESRHLEGSAVRFAVKGVSSKTLYERLDSQWEGGLGLYQESVRIDIRPSRVRWIN